MIDMQLLNGVLVALAVIVGAAITLSVGIVAVAAITQRGQSRRQSGPGGSGGPGRDLPEHPAPETDDARVLVLH